MIFLFRENSKLCKCIYFYPIVSSERKCRQWHVNMGYFRTGGRVEGNMIRVFNSPITIFCIHKVLLCNVVYNKKQSET